MWKQLCTQLPHLFGLHARRHLQLPTDHSQHRKMVIIPAAISDNDSCGGTGPRYQYMNLTIDTPIEFWTQISRAANRRGTFERDTTPLPSLIISGLLAIFVACISTVFARELRVLQLKIDKLQMKTARRVCYKKRHAKQRKELGSNYDEFTRVMVNDESTKMMESIVFSPSLPEGMSLKSSPNSH
jgi:hypothetical protein